MPKALTPLAAAYPEGAEGDATVIVKLVVEKDGSVSDVSIVDGKEPFTAAALAWARVFRFAPATRDGVPIKAAIRAEVKFVAPVPADGPSPPGNTAPGNTPPGSAPPGNTPPGNTPPGSAPPANAAPEPIDVSVRGDVAPPGATTMSRAEVRLLPGAFGDPFRAVEALPGVTPIASGIPYFFVRGAPPGNVGYFLDGIRVPLLYHLGLGPSVVHPAIVDRVDLYPGGYPAQFGRFAGAIVSGETRAPRPDINGEAQIRLVDAGAMLEVPFDGGRGSALAGGRYSYTGLLFSVVQSDLRLDYWDYQTRVSYDVTPSDTVTLFAFGARDFLGDKQGGLDRTLVDTTFHRVDLRYDRKLGPGSTFRQAFTFGYDRTGFDGGGVSDTLFATRSELRYVVSPYTTVRAGLDASVDMIDSTLEASETGSQIPIDLSPRFDFAAGAYADAAFKVDDRLDVTPGLRADFYASDGATGGTAWAIEPRLSAVLRVARWLRLVQAHGFASQRPSFFLPGPGFAPNLGGGLQRSFQTSAGLEADLPLEIEAKVVFFRSAFFNMTDAFGTSTFTDLVTPESFDQRSLGSAIGMEVSAKRRMTKRVGGFVSYTLSSSERAYAQYHLRAGTNRTHVLNAALGVDIGRGFRAGARVVVYTGFPNIVRGPTPTSAKIDTGDDLPPFFRLDARVEKRWSLGRTRWLSLVLEMQNTTLSTENLGVRCDRTCKPTIVGPVSIPSIGLEGGL
jgi:TonB family protein